MNTQESNTAASTESEAQSTSKVMGEFLPYDAQLPIPDVADSRIVKCLYKQSAKDKAAGIDARANVFVRIPTTHLTEDTVKERIAELAPYLVGYLQEIEDTMIKNDHKAGLLSVYTDGLSVDKLIGHLESTGQGARLNAAKIGEWYVAEIQDSLNTAFAEKLGITEHSSDEELAKLLMVVQSYKKKFESLASGKTQLVAREREALIKVIKVAEAENTAIGARLVSRLERMADKQEEELLVL